MADDRPQSKHTLPIDSRPGLARPALVAWFRRRTGDPAEAGNLAQESLRRIDDSGDLDADVDADADADVEAYLDRTARRVLSEHRFRGGSRHRHEALKVAGGPSDDLHILLGKARLRQATAELAKLPERTRSVFLLYRLECLSYAEIALRLNMSISVVRTHMQQAILALLS